MPATPFADLPIYNDRMRPYQDADVLPRVRKWASTDGSGDPDKIDFQRFRHAFLWWDSSKPDEVGSYRLKIADVIDGKLYAIWRGVTVIAGVLQGARGGTTIPDADRDAVRADVARYYAKARSEFNDPSIKVPWDDSSGRSMVAPGRSRDFYDRSFALDDIRILTRAEGYGDGRTVEAYAAVFDVPQEIHDAHGDYIERNDPRAFNMTINSGAAKRALPLYNHGLSIADGRSEALYGVPLGSPQEIRADSRGLLTITRYNKTPLAESVLEAVKAGDITAQSYRGPIFRSSPTKPRGGYRADKDGMLPQVTRHELGLSDYGPTPRPYYADAAIVSVRSAQELASELAGLDEAARSELIRLLATTSPGTPERATATATWAAGTEEPRTAHSGRQQDLARQRQNALWAEIAQMEMATHA